MKAKTYSHVQGLVQGTIWFVFSGIVSGMVVFQFFAVNGKISPLAAVVFMGSASYFAGIFMAIGGIVSARKDYLDGKIKLEPADTEDPGKYDKPVNPWFTAIKQGTIQWPLFALLAFGLCFGIMSGGLSQKAFGLITAHVCLIHGAILVRRTCVPELLKFIAHPMENPPPFHRYLWAEHLLGNGLVNLIINFFFGYIVFHQGAKQPHEFVTPDFFVIDSVGMCLVIAIGVAIGAAMQSSTDVRGGRTLAPTGNFPNPHLALKLAAFPLLAVIGIFAPKYLFSLFGIESFGMIEAMILKGVISCALAMIAAGLSARWAAVPRAQSTSNIE